MVQQFKLIISEKGEIIESVVRKTETDPSVLYKSLEEFRLLANAVLTKLIEKSENDDMGNLINTDFENEEDTCSENDEEEVCSKRRKKKRMNS